MPKPKAGPYYLYMLDYKKEQERNGRTLSMPQVSQEASESWNAMGEAEKEYYKQKAKGGELRLSRPNRNNANDGGPSANGGGGGGHANNGGQLTTQGVPVSVYENAERERKMYEEIMRKRISLLIQMNPLSTHFVTQPIYLMYGNFFYKNNDGIFSPAELAMLKFTFRDGVVAKLHTFINPGTVELGYAYTAKAHSEKTHLLPPPPKAYGTDDFGRILYEIQKFMKGDAKAFDGGKPIIFAYADPYASEDSQLDVLKCFMKQIGGELADFLDIYPLTRLFYTLQKELHEQGKADDIPNENFSNVFLSRDPYETIGGISCAFHEEKDATRHCALSRVHRLAFLLADHFCERLDVQLIPGKHLPENAKVPLPYRFIDGSDTSDTESLSSEVKNGFDCDTKSHDSRGNSSVTGSEISVGGASKRSRQDLKSLASVSGLHSDIQSVRTASSVASQQRLKVRPARQAIGKPGESLPPQMNSSTFYNP